MVEPKPPTVIKTISIRLNTTLVQEEELKKLFDAFHIGINWSLQEIEKRYQKFIAEFKPLEKVKGICVGCNEEKDLQFLKPEVGYNTSKKYCLACAMKTYSEYTIRKEVYGARGRTVQSDLKDVVEIPNKTHYDQLFSQAYAIWKSFNAWRKKRNYEAQMVKKELESIPLELFHTALEIEQNAKSIKQANKKLTWLHANAQASVAVYNIHPGLDKKEIASSYNKLRDLRRLQKPLKLPELKECHTVMMNAGFVKWEDEKLFMTTWGGKQQFDFSGKEYLKQYLQKMEEDNKVYCNLSKKDERYYLMYPLELKVRQPPNLKGCDTFVVMFSPNKIGVFGYDGDGLLNSVTWHSTGKLLQAKRLFKEKRREIGERKSDDEKMRKIRKRKKWIERRGAYEQRLTSTFNHQITHNVIEDITGFSENPKIIIWDIGNGITQNFGRQLNYLKNLWAGVQQQEYLKHKAQQISIPIIEVQYNKCNDLICSSCQSKQMNGNEKKKKPMKVITQLIKGVKNFKCQKCGYEVNMLINQANNIKDLCRSL